MLTLLRWFSWVKFKIFGREFTLGKLLDVFELAQEAYEVLKEEGHTEEAAKEDALDTVAVELGWRSPPGDEWMHRPTETGG